MAGADRLTRSEGTSDSSGDSSQWELRSLAKRSIPAFVAIAVLMLRVKDPGRHRPFRTPMVWLVAPLAIAGTVFLYVNLPLEAMIVLPVWGGIGLVIYFLYGYRKSHLGRGRVEVHEEEPDSPPQPVPPIDDTSAR